MGRELNYLKAVVIVHGKSEKQICNFIKSNLRINIFIESDKNGEKAIQITSLMKRTLNNKKFKSFKSLKSFFDDLQIDKETKQIADGFKIFIIMDTDDCTERQKQDFQNKAMFKDHWAYDYIVPIWNCPNLEEVLRKSGIKFKKKGKKQKDEYIDIFPTDEKYKKSDVLQIKEFYNILENNNNTNMNIFVDFCLEILQRKQ